MMKMSMFNKMVSNGGLWLLVMLAVLLVLILMFMIWYFLIDQKKSNIGEFCSDTSDCASGLVCVGGNQCAKADGKPAGAVCKANSDCMLGSLCLSGKCAHVPGSQLLTSS